MSLESVRRGMPATGLPSTARMRSPTRGLLPRAWSAIEPVWIVWMRTRQLPLFTALFCRLLALLWLAGRTGFFFG
jgi:hypothetical protein